MKKIIGFCLLLLLVFPPVAFSQTRLRTTKRTPAKRSARATTTRKAADMERIVGATKVADQIKILTRFLYLMGGVANRIEAADAAARRNEATPAILAQTDSSKASVRSSLQNVRDGLDQLELRFRTTPELESYYTQLAGVAAGAAKAEELAARNQFDQAGRALLEVVNRLTDVLLDMR